MRSIETTGKTVEEARENAATELGVPVEEIEFEVLDEGGKGFLGIAHAARVKATVEGEPAPEAAETHAEETPAAVERAAAAPSGETASEWTMSLLTNILEAANLQAVPDLKSESEEEVLIELEGPDVAILIGKHGQTLDALQYLLGVAVNRSHDTRTRITLDAEGYRDRQAQMLTEKAIEYARRVKEMGEEAVLDPQPARDRRIMHMALADDDEVYTYSEGDGPDRHVVISPRK